MKIKTTNKLAKYCQQLSIIMLMVLLSSSCITEKHIYTDEVELVNDAENGNKYALLVLSELRDEKKDSSLDDIANSYRNAWDDLQEKDQTGYLKWLIEAAEKGSWRARIAIGEVLYEEDRKLYISENIDFLEKMAIKGSEFARYELIRHYEANYDEDEVDELIEPICSYDLVCDVRWKHRLEREAYQINFMLTMSRIYREGYKGEFINKKRSIEWFDKAVAYLKSIREKNDIVEELYWSYSIYDGTKSGSDYVTKWLFANPQATNAKFFHDFAMEVYKGKQIKQNRELAYQWFMNAAKAGYPPSMFIIASGYDKGGDLDDNPIKAAYWYKKAIDKGYDKAKLPLAYLYKQGRGVDKNEKLADGLIGDVVHDVIEKAKISGQIPEVEVAKLFENSALGPKDAKQAFLWYQKAAQKGDAFAAHELARLYENGIGVEKDMKEAFNLYEMSASKGYEKSQLKLSEFYLNGVDGFLDKNVLLAMKYLVSPAENGNSFAALHLGKAYLNGIDVEQDIPQAQKWLTIAAKKGEIEAMMILGVGYFKGDIFDKNRKLAANWLNLVASSSKGTSKEILEEVDLSDINIYSQDLYSDQIPSSLYILMAKAVDEKDPVSQYKLAAYFDDGPTLEITYPKESNYFYKLAAASGVVNAQFSIAYRYFKGLDIEKDYEKAAMWMALATENDHILAAAYMGLMSVNGYGMNKNIHKGILYYKEAASRGNDWAQYHLGKIYHDGLIIDKDLAIATKWLKKSAVQKNKLARELYCDIYTNEKYLAKTDEFASIWCKE